MPPQERQPERCGGALNRFFHPVMRGGERRRAGLAAFFAALLISSLGLGQAAFAASGVLKVRLGGDRTETRIVIDLAKSASGKVAEDGSTDRRVVLLLDGVGVSGDLQGAGQGLVKNWVMDATMSGARLRIDLAADAVIKRRFLLPPADGVPNYRYVIDLGTGSGKALPARPVKLVTEPVLPSRAIPLPLKKVVVIDAGHGGHDPGARGVSSSEKDVNLSAARALKARLERSGRYKVVMTREDDVYVPLETRVRIAQRADADLFISLHADSGSDTATRGASVYTLADRAAGRTAKFVSKDDWFTKASLHGDTGVANILFDLTQRATKNRSASFAEYLLARVDDHQPLLRRSHREAGLAVLLAPDVPAVLLEMGFITNLDDEAALRDPGKRGQMMAGVGDAIDDYFAQQTRIASR